jgi:hypothetical protein
MLTGRDAFLIPFSVLWCGFALFWEGSVLLTGAWPFALFGLVFVGIGLFMVVGRFLFDAWLRQGTHYGLTDRRVLILRKRPNTDFTAAALDRLPQARLIERKGGSGTIVFGQPAGLSRSAGMGFSIWIPSLDPSPQFLGIRDAREVFGLVQRTSASR